MRPHPMDFAPSSLAQQRSRSIQIPLLAPAGRRAGSSSSASRSTFPIVAFVEKLGKLPYVAGYNIKVAFFIQDLKNMDEICGDTACDSLGAIAAVS